ncbi:MAG: HDOD domain-containing protein [Opitutaceae bacterium]|nr:HDOD domain-containing protein [Verrucomicrobiales bacterium]
MRLFSAIRWPGTSGERKASDATATAEPSLKAKTVAGAPDESPTIGYSDSKRLLFVVSDTARQQSLDQMLQPMRQRWHISVTVASTDLSSLPAAGSYAAVIADAQLTGRGGIDYLTHFSPQNPSALLVLRCDGNDQAELKRHTGPAIQPMAANADVEMVEANLDRMILLNEWMSNPATKTLVGRMKQLPSLPILYTQVVTELQKPDASIEFVARLIATDPMMAAKILQVVNSPFFGLTSEITEPAAAVMFLGTERTKSLVLLAKVFSQFEKSKCEGFSQEQLWRHSMATGAFARSIMMTETRNARLADMAFTAGLLHDVGKLLLAANLPSEYSGLIAQAARRNLSESEIEREALGATHAELGACLLGLWCLPMPILHAVAWHHHPSKGPEKEFSILTAVHASNAFDYEKKKAADAPSAVIVDLQHMEDIGKTEHLNTWRKLCGCAPKAQPIPPR